MVQPHRIGEMIELLPQPTGRQVTELEVLLLPPHRTMPLKPGKRAENDLQRLSQVMSRLASSTSLNSPALDRSCSLRDAGSLSAN